MTLNKDITVIPNGLYCYTGWAETDGNHPKVYGVCPYWSLRKDKPHQENGYCGFLEKGDWNSQDFSLLWDMVKECSENIEDGFDVDG